MLPTKIFKGLGFHLKASWLLFFFFWNITIISAQNRNSVWCFGDSAGLNFGTGVATPIISSMDGRGSCISMSDVNGNLLYYGATMYAYSTNVEISTFIFDSTHSIMQNGDSIVGEGWYHELISIPNPLNDSTYYLFSISVAGSGGLYYSIIDMRLNGGLGAVTQKNIQLSPHLQTDCLSAVKHGNGRDWWIIARDSDFPNGSNNEWHIYLVTSNAVLPQQVQAIGSLNVTNSGRVCFSPDGNKLMFINLLGIVEVFDFDRCTGILSNALTIETGVLVPPAPYFWSCAFSPDGTKIYVTTNDTLSFLYQYDLNAANVLASKTAIWSTNYPIYSPGMLKLAPDNKIYLSSVYYTQNVLYYPYADSMYNMYNMNLSVINQPDSLGSACDFQPYSFYLSGKRTYLGLPNNPDYELGPLVGSPCDTLLSLTEPSSILSPELFVYYTPNWQTAFINAQKLKGHNYNLRVYDLLGNEVFKEVGKLNPPYFTKNLNCTAFAKGMYVVVLQSDMEQLTTKFIIH